MHRKLIPLAQSFCGLWSMPFRISWFLVLVTCTMTFAAEEPRTVRELYIPAEDLERVLPPALSARPRPGSEGVGAAQAAPSMGVGRT